MKSTDVTIIAAPFGFGPTGKSIAIARELIKRGYSVKLLGDQNTLKLANDAGALAYEYKYRSEINLADLRSKVVVSYLDISTKIVNKSDVPLVFADSLFWLRGWFEREYDYPADLTLSQRFFKEPLKKEIEKTKEFHEVGAILSPGFVTDLPEKKRKLVFYPGGLRSPYLGDSYGKTYYDWCVKVIKQGAKLAGWKNEDFVFILPPQLNRPDVLDELRQAKIQYLINCANTAEYFMSATHTFISPGIETTLESLAAGINPLFTPAFNGSHIPQLIADRMSSVGIELSRTFNDGTKKFEVGTDHLSGLSMEVEDYTMDKLSDSKIFDEAVETMRNYLTTDHLLQNRFPLGKDGAKEIVDYLELYLNKERIQNAYYRVSVKAKIKQGDKLILVKEDDKKWDLPGGGVEHKEELMSALNRELAEEIGLNNFVTKSDPKVFKMIDESANRPLLFLVYEIELKDNVELKAADNVKIGKFESDKIPETVSYSKDYTDFIKK